ncbi:BnaC01g32000D [Brassica napus]|uniref:Macro domain-containing protein n=2 Tax=Brassica TaxID=3705 RepID=A0A0D3ABT6_BRAOL|nr:PREDICTED: macro domain-containing protein XCC3184-like [Brassica oleracea var. oleracea]CAF2077150.1 unnamed protein product [Brassica napus]CDY19280.1 BnaC01g32000D [Brassica napus]
MPSRISLPPSSDLFVGNLGYDVDSQALVLLKSLSLCYYSKLSLVFNSSSSMSENITEQMCWLVNLTIHRAAGPQLRAACYELSEVRPGVRCPLGEARITPGFNLPASRAVGPIYDSAVNPEESLSNSYRNSMRVAKENNIKYIAFPAISCGIYGYPFDEAALIGISTIKEFANDFKDSDFLRVKTTVETRRANEMHGLFRTLTDNMIVDKKIKILDKEEVNNSHSEWI